MLDENGNLLTPRFDDPQIAESVTKIYQLGYELLKSWGYEIKEKESVDKTEKQ